MAHKQDREDSELENRTLEITQCEKQWENRLKKKKNSLRDMWDCNKRPNICDLRVPEEKEGRAEKILKK